MPDQKDRIRLLVDKLRRLTPDEIGYLGMPDGSVQGTAEADGYIYDVPYHLGFTYARILNGVETEVAEVVAGGIPHNANRRIGFQRFGGYLIALGVNAMSAIAGLGVDLGDAYVPPHALSDHSAAEADLDLDGFDFIDAGLLNFDAATELTIASGAITAVQTLHTIDTQADAASDDLDTINGGTDGDILIVRANNAARTVVLKHNTGNILLGGGADVSLDETYKMTMLVYDGGLSKWVQVGGSGGSGASPLTTKGDLYVFGSVDDRLPVGTDGQMLFADSGQALGIRWDDPPEVGNKVRWVGTLLHDETLGSSAAFDVSSIPGDYDFLELVMNLRSTQSAADNVIIWLNNDTTAANYRRQDLNVSSTTVAGSAADDALIGVATGSSDLANNFGELRAFLPDYAGTGRHKHVSAESNERQGASTTAIRFRRIWWESTSAITRIMIRTDNHPTDTFVTGSRLRIIGWRQETIGGLETSSANVSNPPTDAELDAEFGTPATVGDGFVALLDDNGADANVYLVGSNGTSWWYTALTKAT